MTKCIWKYQIEWIKNIHNIGASLVAQTVKNLPTMRENWVWSLGWEDPLEKGMAIHSRMLAWRIPCTQEPDGLQSTGWQKVRRDWRTLHTCVYNINLKKKNSVSGFTRFKRVEKNSEWKNSWWRYYTECNSEKQEWENIED